MSTFKIPSQRGIRQTGYGDKSGELWSTKNIDLHTNPGKIKLARPFKQVATASTLEDKYIQAFAIYKTKAYALTSATLFSANSPWTSWSSATSSPSNAQDMVTFDDQLVITTHNNIDAYDGSTFTGDWWTARGNTALTDSSVTPYPHILEVLRMGQETLAVTDTNKVRAYTGSIASGSGTSVTVDLDDIFTTTCIKTSIRKAWIGTFTEDGDQAYVFEWDGASTNYTQSYPVGAKAVLAMETYDNIPIIITERGEIKKFNGVGFTTVAMFPFATKPLFIDSVETSNIQNSNTSRPIHPKGMKRVGSKIFIYVNFVKVGDDIPIDERTPNGIWVFDILTNSLTQLGSQENESIFRVSSPIMVINNQHSRLFVGGKRDTASDEEGIWIEDLSDSTSNYGYFTTVEMESESILDAFNSFYVKALMDSSDKIVVKYRVGGNVNMPLVVEDIAWTSATEFNTTTDLSNVAIGYEIEILKGQGAGRLAHVTKIESSTSTYKITIDESIGSASTTSDIRFDNWTKIDNEFTSTDGNIKKLGANDTGTWIQYKVELRGAKGLPEIRQILSHSNNKNSV